MIYWWMVLLDLIIIYYWMMLIRMWESGKWEWWVFKRVFRRRVKRYRRVYHVTYCSLHGLQCRNVCPICDRPMKIMTLSHRVDK